MSEQRFSSVWDALEGSPEEAANMRMRAELVCMLQDHVAALGVTQAVAAERLGVTQPRLNELLRGRVSKFSIDALVNIASRAGIRVHVEREKSESEIA